tara:strand:- start:494 stop:907 length:414 start_codon:yes stop_codon:yes gene_type:complete
MAYEMKNNEGSFFEPRADQSIFYQGKIKIANEEVDAIIIQNQKKDGESFFRIYTDVGGVKPLTDADKSKFKQNAPSVRGGFTKDFTEYWFTAWSKITQNGGRMLSASIEPKEEQNQIPDNNMVVQQKPKPSDVDMPF